MSVTVTIEIEWFEVDPDYAKKYFPDKTGNVFFYNFHVQHTEEKKFSVNYKIYEYNFHNIIFGKNIDLSIPKLYAKIKPNDEYHNIYMNISDKDEIGEIFFNVAKEIDETKISHPENYQLILLDKVFERIKLIPNLNPKYHKFYLTGFLNMFFRNKYFCDDNDPPLEKCTFTERYRDLPLLDEYSLALWKICNGPKYKPIQENAYKFFIDDEVLEELGFPRYFKGTTFELEKVCAECFAKF